MATVFFSKFQGYAQVEVTPMMGMRGALCEFRLIFAAGDA